MCESLARMGPYNRLMAKCAVQDCTGKVIGGYQHVIPCGTPFDPDAATLDARSFWCQLHKRSAIRSLEMKPGMRLTHSQITDC
jgi:hypothetical protein